ncbi:E3 ubiquitin-protein ligase ZNF598-like [Heliangelus exortis]|uniref:E3 ubiquitin-protein ligase ZNF598-like n=1 Tax=Heliangelus exortis TaxID=472823 RepID=UPI003A949FEE
MGTGQPRPPLRSSSFPLTSWRRLGSSSSLPTNLEKCGSSSSLPTNLEKVWELQLTFSRSQPTSWRRGSSIRLPNHLLWVPTNLLEKVLELQQAPNQPSPGSQPTLWRRLWSSSRLPNDLLWVPTNLLQVPTSRVPTNLLEKVLELHQAPNQPSGEGSGAPAGSQLTSRSQPTSWVPADFLQIPTNPDKVLELHPAPTQPPPGPTQPPGPGSGFPPGCCDPSASPRPLGAVGGGGVWTPLELPGWVFGAGQGGDTAPGLQFCTWCPWCPHGVPTVSPLPSSLSPNEVDHNVNYLNPAPPPQTLPHPGCHLPVPSLGGGGGHSGATQVPPRLASPPDFPLNKGTPPLPPPPGLPPGRTAAPRLEEG